MSRYDTETRNAYIACAAAIVEGRMDLDGADASGFSVNLPVFNVSQTAQLVVIHPQTLRQYDRLGLIVPQRTDGGARRYSLRDVDRLMLAQHLMQDESINLSGVARILTLMEENRELRRQVRRLKQPQGASVFEASLNGQVVEVMRSSRERAQAVARESGIETFIEGQIEEVLDRRGNVRGRYLPFGSFAGFRLELPSSDEYDEDDYDMPDVDSDIAQASSDKSASAQADDIWSRDLLYKRQ